MPPTSAHQWAREQVQSGRADECTPHWGCPPPAGHGSQGATVPAVPLKAVSAVPGLLPLSPGFSVNVPVCQLLCFSLSLSPRPPASRDSLPSPGLKGDSLPSPASKGTQTKKAFPVPTSMLPDIEYLWPARALENGSRQIYSQGKAAEASLGEEGRTVALPLSSLTTESEAWGLADLGWSSAPSPPPMWPWTSHFTSCSPRGLSVT